MPIFLILIIVSSFPLPPSNRQQPARVLISVLITKVPRDVKLIESTELLSEFDQYLFSKCWRIDLNGTPPDWRYIVWTLSLGWTNSPVSCGLEFLKWLTSLSALSWAQCVYTYTYKIYIYIFNLFKSHLFVMSLKKTPVG